MFPLAPLCLLLLSLLQADAHAHPYHPVAPASGLLPTSPGSALRRPQRSHTFPAQCRLQLLWEVFPQRSISRCFLSQNPSQPALKAPLCPPAALQPGPLCWVLALLIQSVRVGVRTGHWERRGGETGAGEHRVLCLPSPKHSMARPGDPVAPVFRNLPLTLAPGRGLQAMWKGWPLSLWLHQTDVT